MKNLFKLLGLVFLPLLSLAQNPNEIDLLNDTISISEVTVSASLPLGNKDILDYYRTNHFATIDNINARMEGMSLIKRGAYAMEPMLHGFSGGQLNVTIDGMKMFGACTDKMDPVTSYIEPTNLKTISVNHGTSGSMNGCNIGGSVDMTLQEPAENALSPTFGSLGFGYESVSRGRNVLFSSGFGVRKWAFGIDGVYRKNENYRDGNNQVIPFSQFEKANLHSVLKYNIDETSHLKADFLYDIARNVGYPALPMDVSKARAGLAALEYTSSGKTEFKAKIYVNSVLHIMDDSKRDSTFFLKNKQTGQNDTVYMRMDMPGRSTTFGTYIQAERFWSRKNKITLKLDNYTNQSLAEMTMYMNRPATGPEPPMYMQTWPEMMRNVSGFYIQNTTFISPEFQFSVDGRVDYDLDVLKSEYGQQQFSVFGYALAKKHDRLIKSLNLSSKYRFNDQFSLAVSGGYSERLPTIGERLGFYLYNAYDGFDYIGNPYLKTEKSDFVRLNVQFARPGLKLNLSQSYSYISDYILGITDPSIPPMNFYTKGTRIYSNIPSAKLFSTDLDLLYSPARNLSVFMLSKFTLGRLNSGDPIPLIPPFKNIISVKYQVEKFILQLENETSLAQNRVNAAYGESATPGYSVFHAKGSYAFKIQNRKVDFGWGMTNILNKAYYEHLDFGRINRPGRSLELFLNYIF
ncbi:MAG: TonB-dependent receptor [Prolixibacteraceae bacterium]